jgi:hypothetical protein
VSDRLLPDLEVSFLVESCRVSGVPDDEDVAVVVDATLVGLDEDVTCKEREVRLGLGL